MKKKKENGKMLNKKRTEDEKDTRGKKRSGSSLN